MSEDQALSKLRKQDRSRHAWRSDFAGPLGAGLRGGRTIALLFQKCRFRVALAGPGGRLPERLESDRYGYSPWTVADVSDLPISPLLFVPVVMGFAHVLAMAFVGS